MPGSFFPQELKEMDLAEGYFYQDNGAFLNHLDPRLGVPLAIIPGLTSVAAIRYHPPQKGELPITQ